MSRLSTCAAFTGAAMTFVLLGAPTAVADTAPAPSNGTSSPGYVGGVTSGSSVRIGSSSSDEALTPEQIDAQIAQAKKLQATLAKSNKTVAAKSKALDAVSAKANKLLEDYSKAKSAERAARDQASAMRKESARMKAQLAQDKRELRNWAYQAYTNGGELAQTVDMIDSLGKDASKAGSPAGDLEYMTEEKVRLYQRVREMTEEQQRLTDLAEQEEKEAIAQAAKAKKSKAAADAVVKKHRAELASLRKTIDAQVKKGATISGILGGSSDAGAKAAAASLQKVLGAAGKVPTQAKGKACSNDNKEYPNGQVPASGLCPLYKASGETLRPAASVAFNAMSKAYEKATGKALCVTDSYRSYGEQVAVKASRGMWAARPGTSNHGYGVAVDLCGGVNNFGTPAHQWMRQNGPTYGWFHPGWAEPGGALPEPWHWEYAG